MTGSNRGRVIVASGVLLTLTGCIARTEESEGSVYRIELWVCLLATLACLVAIPAGWLLREKVARLGYALLILGPIGLVLSPSLFLDRTIVAEDHFDAKYGLWFAPNHKVVRFDDLSRIVLKVEERRTRRGKRMDYSLDCVGKNGQVENVPLGNVLQEAVGEILAHASSRGVPIQGLDDTP